MSGVEAITQDMHKVASLVATARRLVGTGAVVDLSALDEKVRHLCQQVEALEREQGRDLVPALEALIAQLDELAQDLEQRVRGG